MIVPFEFPKSIQQGMRARLLCSIMQGDPPFTFSWFKDGRKLDPSTLSLGLRSDDYSTDLTFHRLTTKHNGNYSCLVKNDVASISHSATLFLDGSYPLSLSVLLSFSSSFVLLISFTFLLYLQHTPISHLITPFLFWFLPVCVPTINTRRLSICYGRTWKLLFSLFLPLSTWTSFLCKHSKKGSGTKMRRRQRERESHNSHFIVFFRVKKKERDFFFPHCIYPTFSLSSPSFSYPKNSSARTFPPFLWILFFTPSFISWASLDYYLNCTWLISSFFSSFLHVLFLSLFLTLLHRVIFSSSLTVLTGSFFLVSPLFSFHSSLLFSPYLSFFLSQFLSQISFHLISYYTSIHVVYSFPSFHSMWWYNCWEYFYNCSASILEDRTKGSSVSDRWSECSDRLSGRRISISISDLGKRILTGFFCSSFLPTILFCHFKWSSFRSLSKWIPSH